MTTDSTFTTSSRPRRPEGVEPGASGLRAATLAATLTGGSIFAAAFVLLESPYGLSLFVLAPFATGWTAAWWLLRTGHPRAGHGHGAAQLALLLGKIAMLLFGVEGVLCLGMAYPLTAPLAALGVVAGRALAGMHRPGPSHGLMVLLWIPWMLAVDGRSPEPPLREVETSIEVDASVEQVWARVIAFPDLPPPSAAAFRLGIAYPIRARIVGHGVGAVRYCEFSTGAFVEPITRWEEPYRLSFDVVSQPPTMQEWSPYDIHPPHLKTSLRSERGEFRLEPLPGGRTRLEGSTWYRQDLAPYSYWNLWSDALIHRIHRRVLRHIAQLAEGDGPPEPGSRDQLADGLGPQLDR